MNQDYDLIIVGGGIGGLTTAHFLLKTGLRVLVLEKSPGLNELGAGLWLAPNALLALREIKLLDIISRLGWPMHRAELRSTKSGLLQSVDLQKAGQAFGLTTLAIHRGLLQKTLAQHLEPSIIRYGTEIQEIQLLPDRVEVQLKDGPILGCKILIGADGLRSQTRDLLFDPVPLRYSGTSSYRGVTSTLANQHSTQVSAEIWGPACRFGYSHINARDIYWYLTFDAPAGQTQSTADRKARAAALMSHFPEQSAIVESTQPEHIIHTDISDLTPHRDWVRGRVALLGDAAHATTPNLGQGAAQAIEDAWAISLALAEHGLEPKALAHYMRVRQSKALWVVDQSWNFQKLCHMKNPLLQSLRDLVVKHSPGFVQEKTLRRIFTPEVTSLERPK